ncbi:MAG TPA: carbohydrate-binding family 9-like protein [Gemmataceae bacterium]|nr:carbohydrate-binding family 9-like protein [Gemmataceae bacterium]
MRIAWSLVLLMVGVGVTLPDEPKPKVWTVELEPCPHPKGYVCHRVTKPLTIDGKLNDEAWSAAPWSGEFVDIEGDKKPKPRHRTRMKMLWDDEALYIAAELEEPHVWAYLTEHDSVIFQDNDFEVFIDPNGDSHDYGEFEMNARNTTWDLFLTKPYKDGGRVLNAWEILGLKTATHIDGTLNDPTDTDKGWTLEIRWPWKGLQELASSKLPPKDGEQWRINFSRVEWDTTIEKGKYQKVKGRPEHNWVWSPQGVIDMHRPERWGYLQFSTAEPGKVDFKPDVDWARRDLLHRVYYAQHNFRKQHGTFAGKLADLGLKNPTDSVTIEATRRTFEASVTEPHGGQRKPKKWTIIQDSRLVVE